MPHLVPVIGWESLFDRRKFNRMNGEQIAYVESLKARAARFNAKNARKNGGK